MMNAQERRDLEELRAYYNRIQKVIEKIQEKNNKIDLSEHTQKGSESALMVACAAKAIYQDVLKMIFEAEQA